MVYVFTPGRRSGRAVPAARRRGRRACWRSSIWPSSAAGASRISPGPSISRRCGCAATAIARRSPRPGCRRSTASTCPASGRRPGAARPSRRLFDGAPSRPTRCSAATTRSPAARPTRCASAASPCRGDVAIVGFDNWEVMTLAARPPLTSIDMNLKALGREAGDRLIDMIAGKRVRRRRAPALLAGGAAVVRLERRESGCMSQFTPVRFVDVSLEGQFWRERLETVLTRTIPSQHVQLGKHGILESLTLPNPPPPLRFPRNQHDFTVQVFWDSDVGKWIEAASYALSHRRDADIEAKIEAIVDDLEKAQAPDGYLNCWYLQREPENRWTNLRDNHELYNLGHLLEGAIAYFLATGRRRLLDILERYVDHVRGDLRPGPGPEARLLRPSGDRAGADQALPPDRRAQAARPRQPISSTSAAASRTISTRRPSHAARIRRTSGRRATNTTSRTSRCASRSKVVGHAVRAMYMYSAMADLAAELERRQPEARLRDAVGRRHGLEDLHHLGPRPGRRQRRLHRRLRPAQRHRLCRDLRLGGADLLGAAHAASRSRRQICRRAGAGAVQRRALPACRATASTISTPIRSTATAATAAGPGTPARAAR